MTEQSVTTPGTLPSREQLDRYCRPAWTQEDDGRWVLVGGSEDDHDRLARVLGEPTVAELRQETEEQREQRHAQRRTELASARVRHETLVAAYGGDRVLAALLAEHAPQSREGTEVHQCGSCEPRWDSVRERSVQPDWPCLTWVDLSVMLATR